MNGPPSLPACGDWEGPIYGELGVLAETPDGDQVRCHACGGWYRSLATHAVRAHGLTAAEYRAIFGLRARTALAGAALRTRRRELAGERLRAYQPRHAHLIADQTFEERSRRR